MEAILGRNNAPLGFNWFRYTWGASTAAIFGTIGAREKSSHRLYYEYKRTATAVLANEIASGRFQFFNCNFTRCVGRCCRFGGCIVSNVTVGCTHRSRLQCDQVQCHFIHNSYGGQYQFVPNFCIQLGKIIYWRIYSQYLICSYSCIRSTWRFTHCWPNIWLNLKFCEHKPSSMIRWHSKYICCNLLTIMHRYFILHFLRGNSSDFRDTIIDFLILGRKRYQFDSRNWNIYIDGN